jgi:hypothetical protein
VPETFREIQGNSLANTVLTDRELLIHAVQHLEDLAEQMADVHGAVLRIDGALSVFAPLLAKYAPGGKPDFLSIRQGVREAKREARDPH